MTICARDVYWRPRLPSTGIGCALPTVWSRLRLPFEHLSIYSPRLRLVRVLLSLLEALFHSLLTPRYLPRLRRDGGRQFVSGAISAQRTGIVVFTDGSGGEAGTDVRLRRCGWAYI